MIAITGASDGLGRQLAKIYKEAGKRVVNLSRRESQFADENIVTDLTDENSVSKAIERILAMPEPLDILVNCAGVISLEPLAKITPHEIDRTFGVNVKGAVLLVSGLVGRIRQDRSDIVNVASTVGLKA